ncbi:MAG: Gldg family protein [Verrucomicrobia bacterium]|nr:Gldg family protein [Verrucomicrobiota bacterium]MBV8485407.1 Gldg family protein [Verrucomicrobiota bacterium]
MKKVETWLFPVAGVVAVLVILIAVNVLGSFLKVRSDLTQNKIYTLSPGTKRILDKLDTPVEIRFYYSKDNSSMPVPLRTYAQEVEDLLSEYQQAGHGKIQVVKLDPKPDSDAEDSARLDGVQGQTVAANLTGDKIYLGLAVSCLDTKTAIPFLSPDRETLLEYDISRAISSVVNPKKAVIGVMSDLPVLGRAANPMMMMQRQRGSDPWVFVQELKENYTVREVPLTADKIDDDISVLLVDYPKGITESAQFAIDQFMLRGGKMVALLDPFSFVDSQLSGGQQAMMRGETYSANLDKLLKAWGLEFTADKIVADPNLATKIQRQTGSVDSDMTVLSVNGDTINKSDPLGASTTDLLLPFAGAFKGTPISGLKQETLVSTTPQAGLIDASTVMLGSEGARKFYKPGNTPLALAVRLTGKFKTAFPDGKPAAAASPTPTPAASPAASATPTPTYLKEATKEGVAVLIGDSDFAFDQIAGRQQQMLNQVVFTPNNGNLNLIESSVELLAGDSNLMSIRSRTSANRPFVLVDRMEAAAQDKYQSKIDELETSLTQARQKLSELQSAKQADQKSVLSPEQQAEIKKFQENEAQIDKQLKQVRKELRQEIDSLQNWLKWLNIALMPLVVTCIGLGLAFFKKRSRAAR